MIEPKADPKSIDPRKLGLKVGLEIHQQLDTRHKLFCKCQTTLLKEGEAEDTFTRQLRPTRSELGEVDVAALFEWRKGRMYYYHMPRSLSCLVEADEEPPHEINREAVVIGLAIAKALESRVVDEIYVMRKIVLDGSNTTGFQRTALIALGGHIKLPSGKTIGIETIAVEEDAARKVGEEDRYTHYVTDRLGIPLIEISTSPDIETPEEAYEAALTIGQLLRLTGRVKRGIGTIRQDLNISIKEGTRIEIKGVQRLELLPKIVLYEALRQYRLLQVRDELRRRGVTVEELREAARITDVTSVFEKTRSEILRRVISRGGRILAVRLRKFHGLLGVEVQPGRRFGAELADYARFWSGVGGLLHSDELPGYGITSEELREVYRVVGAVEGEDAVVIVAGDEQNARKALEAVIERAVQAFYGVPKETRAAQDDGTTRFMRPQPGAARMYPETDVPPIEVTHEMLMEAERIKPMHPLEKVRELTEKYGLSRELASQLLRSPYLGLFEELAARYHESVSASYIASIVTSIIKNIQREGAPVENLNEDNIRMVVEALARNIIGKDVVPDILKYLAEKPSATIEDALKALKVERMELSEVEKLVEEAVQQNIDAIREMGLSALNRVMGYVMPKVRGRVDGKVVAEIARKKILEVLGGRKGE